MHSNPCLSLGKPRLRPNPVRMNEWHLPEETLRAGSACSGADVDTGERQNWDFPPGLSDSTAPKKRDCGELLINSAVTLKVVSSPSLEGCKHASRDHGTRLSVGLGDLRGPTSPDV